MDPTSALTGEANPTGAVRQDIEASRSWVYAHADELGGYRVGRRLWFRWQRTPEDTGREEPKRTQRIFTVSELPTR